MPQRSEERLQKVLARAGIASRRQCEKMISDGRVKVNGLIVMEQGTRVDVRGDRIEIDGKLISRPEEKVYLLLNKPRGFITSLHDPPGRPKVTDLIKDITFRLYPVGRLDMETEGLLLLTNDGDLCYRLSHPRFGVEKTYQAKVMGVPSPQKIKLMSKGMVLDDGSTSAAKVRLLDQIEGNGVLLITIHEGKNRQVRRMLEAVGHPVISLKRIQYGFLELRGIRTGSYRKLNDDEVRRLRQLVELEQPRTVRQRPVKGAGIRRRGLNG